MTPRQIALVQETWREIVPIADAAAIMFYGRLFALDPRLRKLFARVDIQTQSNKLIMALGMVVGRLKHLDSLTPTIADLGRRHGTYGVVDADYDTVGEALLWTLEQGLGQAWTDEVRDAWAAAYALLSDVMRDAAGPSRAAA